ncbi:hypothetical protein PMIN01_03578 [Paraphaeosphaeria minitans]|uniref:Uncharacterized protein n=1 Tax=Paraphaeosphaeria minitans TaxID=565426 RepID=A0A9P6KTH8_9PLEO|nr:hypothetical protein PMIN01_03578 [Paraphaeosphaeria minitans]
MGARWVPDGWAVGVWRAVLTRESLLCAPGVDTSGLSQWDEAPRIRPLRERACTLARTFARTSTLTRALLHPRIHSYREAARLSLRGTSGTEREGRAVNGAAPAESVTATPCSVSIVESIRQSKSSLARSPARPLARHSAQDVSRERTDAAFYASLAPSPVPRLSPFALSYAVATSLARSRYARLTTILPATLSQHLTSPTRPRTRLPGTP